MFKQLVDRFKRTIPGQVYLWLAVLIFGAANSVTRKVTDIGAQHLIDGRNPVSLCNVLFVGNMCALFVLVLLHRQQLKLLKDLSQQQWTGLIAVAVLSGAIAPAFIFQALSVTAVNNVVLVGRLEPPIALVLSIWLLRERVTRLEILSAIVVLIGVMLSVLLQPPTEMIEMAGLSFGKGEALTALGAIALAVSTVISKTRLTQVPIGLFSIVRTALGTVVFFVLALLLYGHHHFMDVFAPFLWKWMLVYGTVIVVLGQSFWLLGLQASTVSRASLISSFTPIAGVAFAYLILGETPTTAHYIGGSIVLVGIGLSQMVHQKSRTVPKSASTVQTIENETGFKGL
ncbi:DMT family transporter [Pseudanabaenaceae cyanobacterium LEGE 13415]|nr:DMT family transporter [Pseudanabaenaceae cyanobacterium LEGE 13415]